MSKAALRSSKINMFPYFWNAHDLDEGISDISVNGPTRDSLTLQVSQNLAEIRFGPVDVSRLFEE